MLEKIEENLRALADPERAKALSRFFKTGPGEYGEGDLFLGVRVPDQRRIAKKYLKTASMKDVTLLLSSPYHEHRLTALLLLVHRFQRADELGQEKIVHFYLRNTGHINNWDLVDLSAEKILGSYLLDRDKSLLYELAGSENLWERRIAVIATFAFIKAGRFTDTLKIAEMLLTDQSDLIHKAVGWMLREIGKRDQDAEEGFLKKHRRRMPRVMLRYAIEKMSEEKRRYYLGK